MILKDYQNRTLEAVGRYFEQLHMWRAKDMAARSQDPDWGFDWVRKAWEGTVPGRPYRPRSNGLGEHLPAFCLKIPTGGGKTLLATKVIDLATTFRQGPRGLVLWIVPTTQIYQQTLKALKDRDHPYRQQLDLSSGQRTLILEKTTVFGPEDVAENLCVLLLMLPSANRQTKDRLRMFRDSGGFDRFFPDDDSPDRHAELLDQFPNLDTFEQVPGFWGRYVKSSLGNTIRRLRPLIILDEGHKAYSANAKATLEGFNPSMIVELSATPAKGSNVLVEILGRELNAEEMIKLDLHIRNKASGDWKDTLLASVDHRAHLEREAQRHEAETGTYIRPICVIQVERTGKEQRKPGLVHTDDVREYLLQHPGVNQEHIAIKTSARDELKEVDDIGGLLSRDCPIRFIITKQALQEGWDCPFAYILAILNNPMSRTGITQLVGRILRQPYAHKTGVSWLDESYVFCYSRRGGELLKEVKKGFGMEGLQGLESKVVSEDGPPQPTRKLTTKQRTQYERATRGFVLPAFMIRDIDGWRLVHYEADILSRVCWEDIDLDTLADLQLGQRQEGDYSIAANLDEDRQVQEQGMNTETENAISDNSSESVNYFLAAIHLRDLVPNPWRGRELARQAFEALLERYPADRVAANQRFVLTELRRRVGTERDRLSRQVFHDLLESGTMRFLVVAENLGFTALPTEIKVPKGKRANREDGSPYQRNLFDATMEDDLNQLENRVATYLDKQAAMFFWYRNRPRKDYYVQGWKPQRIYADFILTLRESEHNQADHFSRVFVVETKGIHLKQSEDTEYKRSVFDICNRHAREAAWAEFAPAMRNRTTRFEVVDEEEWQHRLNGMLFGEGRS